MQLFFELFRIALGNAVQLSRVPTVQEWGALFDCARRHAVMGIFFHGIEQLPVKQRPPREILLQWYAATEQIKRMNREVNRDAVSLTRRLEKDGFPAVVLKGQGVAALYPDPLLRMPGDIDVYVKGSRQKVTDYLLRTARGHLHIAYKEAVYPTEERTVVEIHYTPALLRCPWTNWHLQHFMHGRGSDLWGQVVELPEGVGVIPVPGRRFNAVFLLAHIYRHLFGEGIGWRQIVDYHYFLMGGLTERERMDTVKILKSLRMWRFTRGMMYVLQTYLGLPEKYLLTLPDKAEGDFLMHEIMRGGNFNRYDDFVIPRDEGRVHRLFRVMHANSHLFVHYPQEVFFNPLFSLWQHVWQRAHGYV